MFLFMISNIIIILKIKPNMNFYKSIYTYLSFYLLLFINLQLIFSRYLNIL